jgi:general secretion pathway protein K
MTPTSERAAGGALRSERGIALILVLWVFMALSVLVGEFSRAMREDAVATQNLAEEVQGRGVAMAGMNQAIYRSLRGRERNVEDDRTGAGQVGIGEEELEVWQADGVPHEGEYAGGTFRVRIFDEGAKISLNRADEALLRRVFASLGFELRQQEEIVDAILDWRDSDDLDRAHGAESDYYQKQRTPYYAKNGPFDSVEELMMVRGITYDLFYGIPDERARPDDPPPIALRDVFSVFNRSANINVRTASPAVLWVLLDGEEEDVEEVTAARETDPGSALTLLRAKVGDPLLARRLVDRSATTVTIDSRAKMQHGQIEARIGAVVDISEDADGFHVVRWSDRLAAR